MAVEDVAAAIDLACLRHRGCVVLASSEVHDRVTLLKSVEVVLDLEEVVHMGVALHAGAEHVLTVLSVEEYFAIVGKDHAEELAMGDPLKVTAGRGRLDLPESTFVSTTSLSTVANAPNTFVATHEESGFLHGIHPDSCALSRVLLASRGGVFESVVLASAVEPAGKAREQGPDRELNSGGLALGYPYHQLLSGLERIPVSQDLARIGLQLDQIRGRVLVDPDDEVAVRSGDDL